ncbi:unnamed protein product [Cuscuta epithymum]|uniref:DUF4283 domain-containing protein n=1 Tax=Cuscuta epithymum TaxID=186058 RepID=A0AAV0C7R2_9ASTE|nr:unnamed protein product [Cuscuta epithymum]CAH9140793.1 unnamed protein product [Cuscuta epithymum]
MDDIVHQYKQMGIAEDKEELIFDDDDERHTANDGKMTFPLVGKVLTDRKIKLQIFKKLMASLWRPVKGVSTKEIGEKRYIFSFYHNLDMRCVLDECPWFFERNLLILKEIKANNVRT